MRLRTARQKTDSYARKDGVSIPSRIGDLEPELFEPSNGYVGKIEVKKYFNGIVDVLPNEIQQIRQPLHELVDFRYRGLIYQDFTISHVPVGCEGHGCGCQSAEAYGE